MLPCAGSIAAIASGVSSTVDCAERAPGSAVLCGGTHATEGGDGLLVQLCKDAHSPRSLSSPLAVLRADPVCCSVGEYLGHACFPLTVPSKELPVHPSNPPKIGVPHVDGDVWLVTDLSWILQRKQAELTGPPVLRLLPRHPGELLATSQSRAQGKVLAISACPCGNGFLVLEWARSLLIYKQ